MNCYLGYLKFIVRKIALQTNENVPQSVKLEHQKFKIKIKKKCFVIPKPKGTNAIFRNIISSMTIHPTVYASSASISE